MKAAVITTPGSVMASVFALRSREPASVTGRVSKHAERLEITAARLRFGVAVARAEASIVLLANLGIEKFADELQT